MLRVSARNEPGGNASHSCASASTGTWPSPTAPAATSAVSPSSRTSARDLVDVEALAHQVVRVEPGPVAVRGVAGLGDAVGPGDDGDAAVAQLLADHAVAGAEVEGAQVVGRRVPGASTASTSAAATVAGEAHCSRCWTTSS